MGRNGTKAQWTPDEHERLIDEGWSRAQAKMVANLLFSLQNSDPVSRAQLDTYANAYGISATQDNVARMARTICSARAAACLEATKRLSESADDAARWIDAALDDDAPFASDQVNQAQPTPASPIAQPSKPLEDVAPRQADPDPGTRPLPPERTKKRLLDAGEECIAAYTQEGAWDTNSAKQVRTALRMFDHACGGDVHIQDLLQSHVTAFTELCQALPRVQIQSTG